MFYFCAACSHAAQDFGRHEVRHSETRTLSNGMPEKDGHLQSKKSPGMLLLPSRQNDRPIEASELREILSWTLNEPTWETELVSGLTVQRLSARDDSRDCYVERGRCEVVLDAPIETVFALVDDPEERAKWDDLVGPSMMKYKASGCRFVSFKFDGLMGLAAEQFFFWDAQQAYDRNCLECETWPHDLWCTDEC